MDGLRLAARLLGTLCILLAVAGLWMVTAAASGAPEGTPSCVPFWPCDPTAAGPGGIVSAGVWVLVSALACGIAAGALGSHARKRSQAPSAPHT